MKTFNTFNDSLLREATGSIIKTHKIQIRQVDPHSSELILSMLDIFLGYVREQLIYAKDVMNHSNRMKKNNHFETINFY